MTQKVLFRATPNRGKSQKVPTDAPFPDDSSIDPFSLFIIGLRHL